MSCDLIMSDYLKFLFLFSERKITYFLITKEISFRRRDKIYFQTCILCPFHVLFFPKEVGEKGEIRHFALLFKRETLLLSVVKVSHLIHLSLFDSQSTTPDH